MATPRFFRVKAVEGFHVLDVVNIGIGHRIVGYGKVDAGTRQLFGIREPQQTFDYVRSEEPVMVAETRDSHMRNAIIGGALDYVETVDGIGAKAKAWREPNLVRATTFNLVKRAKAAASLKKSDSDSASATEKMLAEADAARDAAMSEFSGSAKSTRQDGKSTGDNATDTTKAAPPVTGV